MRCLEVFVACFNASTNNQSLNILGYDQPDFKLSDNCNFISMGKQGPVQEWSTDLKKYFSNYKGKHFIYGTEDAFLYKPSNIKLVNLLIKFVEANDWIGKMALHRVGEEDGESLLDSAYSLDFFKTLKNEFGGMDLYVLNNSQYTLTTQLSIWNRDFFLRYLTANNPPYTENPPDWSAFKSLPKQSGITPWQFEVDMSFFAKNDKDFKSVMIDTAHPPLYKVEGYAGSTRKGRRSESVGWEYKERWLHFLSDDLKNKIKQ